MQYFNDSRYRLMIEMNMSYINDKIMREIVFEDDKNVSDYGLDVATQFCNKLGNAENESDVRIKINDSMKECAAHIQNIVGHIKQECVQYYPFQLDLWIIPKDWRELDENGNAVVSIASGPPIEIEKKLSENNLYYVKQHCMWNNDYSSNEEKIDHDTVRDKLFKYIKYNKTIDNKISDEDLENVKKHFETEEYDSDAIEDFLQDEKQYLKDVSNDLKKEFVNDKQKTIDLVFRKICNDFVAKLKQLNDQSIQKRRICVIIDRRDTFDVFYIFDPPEETNRFDIHRLPELYFERSAKYPIFPVLKDNSNGEHPVWGLFTTFHIESPNNIKAYQYWNKSQNERIGGRFFSVDMINIWKNYFVMNDINKDFVMNTNLNQLKMTDIPDIAFEKWYNTKVDNFRKKYNYSLTKLRHDKKEREEKEKLIQEIELLQATHFVDGLDKTEFKKFLEKVPARFKIIFSKISFKQNADGKEIAPFDALIEIANQCIYEY
eukprot:517142_1